MTKGERDCLAGLEFKNYLNEYLTERDTPVENLEEIIAISSGEDFSIDETVLERLEEAQSRGSFTDNFYQRTLDTGPDIIRRILTESMKKHDPDALVAPTGSCPPEPLPSAEDIDYDCENTPSRTLLGNISGYPEVSVPIGFTSDGLPISVLFLGQAFCEPTLFGLAYLTSR
ncbi:glutamyl-tRNA(Gln) amidotransferase subunit A [Halalkalicoccus paucihalophilus]|uniref:Glutamyl-tRNA(Gln) amidotransferase subunit A n=1 Tax=Halalkalicoccus paucihalophilus TaxID=1008153 RepID=A0A151A904_9EURY|nr:amidase family protein [Halalkalicoccus paucihalophilus]KYH24050.1 glutamyl-tRNA(Gln) amidotransferase subunit A [Halalkalicoccus paucihalophilus]